MRIGVIGCGNIASAVVHGIAKDGHQFTVSERSERYSKALSEAYSNVTVASNQAVADASEIIFLGLLADRAPEVLGAIQFREGQQIISFMAGATLNQADQLVLPAHAVALMMPFPGIAEGGSPIIVQGDADLVRTVFGAHNSIFALSNSSEMAAYLCAQATLSPVAQMLEDAAQWLGERVQDTDQGEAFLRALVVSSLSNRKCADLIEALNTPGGYNQKLRVHMEANGMGAALKVGLDGLE